MKKMILGLFTTLLTSLSMAAVNINTASVSELEALPGIGPAKAKAIVAYRDQNGAFKNVEDLKNVKGIGEGIFSKLKDEAAVGSNSTPKTAKPAINKMEEKSKL